MEKEIKITPPEGYEIDKENSTFECIKFKPIENKRWRDNEDAKISGYWIDPSSIIGHGVGFKNTPNNYNIFATEKQAKSALAVARISQIMANDERFGGVITDEEWNSADIPKHIIGRCQHRIIKGMAFLKYHILAFHTYQQRDLFLEENEDLVRDYLCL